MYLLMVKICLLTLSYSYRGQSATCPALGTDQSSMLSRSFEERIFMNFDSPAQCQGNLTGWRFCYYRNVDDKFEDTSDSQIFAAVFILYRKQSATSNYYIPVPGSVREKQILWRNIRGSSFQCSYEGLSIQEYFEIQENDIVGACIKHVGSIEPLLLVGTSSESNLLTYQWDEGSYEDCLSSQYSTVDTSHKDFILQSTSILHLFANISVSVSCTAGSNIDPAVAVTSGLTGTYLNVESPVSCNNHITKWHYCYYPQAATPGSTLSMTVAVWSLDVATNAYIVNPSSIKNITIQPVQTLAKIFCIEESLNESEFVLVSQNDVIGVSLPSSNAIPILGSNASSSISLKRHTLSSQPSNFIISELTDVTSSVLHIYATVEYRIIPTTVDKLTTARATTSSVKTQQEVYTSLDTNGGMSSNRFSVGYIVAITLSIGLITIAILLFVLLGLYLKKRKHRNDLMSKQAFENCLYSEDIPTSKKHIQLKELDCQPYDYVTRMLGDDHLKNSDSNSSHYEFAENNNYYAQVDSEQGYLQELELIRQGNAKNKPESIYCEPGHTEEELYSFLKQRKINNIPDRLLRTGNILGSGNFGTVYEGEWRQNSKQALSIALKYPKDNATKKDRVNFLKEAVTMAQFKHPNVIALYGISIKNGKTILVMEHLSKGDLFKFLQTLRPDQGELVPLSTPNLLLQFAQQICLGMHYLSVIGYIHRDLASRNVLISNSFTCKIADFGMSRDLNDCDYYTSTGNTIPLKWTAPEAIHYKKYSTASDVWSYGCVLYEIWSLGHKPFEAMENMEVLRVIDTNKRLAPPPGCPKRIYEIMMQCWNPKAENRPNFENIVLTLSENKEFVLHISQDVTDAHPQAAVLGAPLNMGFNMYLDIQKTYITN